MQKTSQIGCAVIIAALLATAAVAGLPIPKRNLSLPDKNLSLSDEALDIMKSILLSGLDKKIERLEKAIADVQDAPVDEGDKELFKSVFTEAIAQLESYKSDVEAAQSAEELIAIRTEANQYIMDNKDEIIQTMKALAAAISDEMVVVFEKTIEKMKAALAQLEQECPKGADDIAVLNKMIAELEKALALYESSPEAGKAYLAKMLADVEEIVKSIEELAEECGDVVKKNVQDARNSTVAMQISGDCDAREYAGDDPIAYVEHEDYTIVVRTMEDLSVLEGDPCVTVLTKAKAKQEMQKNRNKLREQMQEKLSELGINRTLSDILDKDTLREYLDEMNKEYQDFVTPDAVSQHADGDAADIYSDAVGWIWVSDTYLHRTPEKWLLPDEFIEETPDYPNNPAPGEMVSDCSEQANTLVSLLIASGEYSAENARVTLGVVNFGGSEGGHAWAEVYEDGEWMALEATSGSYYDEKKGKVVGSDGVAFDYFAYNEFPAVETWYHYNDKYLVDAATGQGNAPSHW